MLMRLEEIGSQHGRDQPSAQERKKDLYRDRYAELLEELARNGGHEARRQEHRDNSQADGDDDEAYLVGGLERRLIRCFAHPYMPDDVLDLDDGIINENACAEHNREQAHD